MAHTLKIYGASDDLIELDGDIREEINHIGGRDDDGLYLAISDGTLLHIRYGEHTAQWKITRIFAGSASFERYDATNEDDDYTDIVTLTSGNKFEWVLSGEEFKK